jgi:hypothetical protein
MIFQFFDFLRSCVFHFLDLSFLGTPGLQFGTLWALMWPSLAPIWPPFGLSFWSLGTLWARIWPPTGLPLSASGLPLVRFWAPWLPSGHILSLKATIRPHTVYY